MDTSKIVMTRIGWEMGNNSKDSCLHKKMYQYSSGLFKEELQLCSEYGTITISKQKIERPFYGQDFKPVFSKSFTKGSVYTKRYYYDESGYLDSVILKEGPGERAVVSKSIKKFDARNRIETLKNHDGTLHFKYDTEGKLEKTILIMSNGARKVTLYKNDKLINESWFDTSDKKYREQKYAYDTIGNPVRIDLNKYEHWSYEYNEYGLTKEEKWVGADNKTTLEEQIIYLYDNDGNLTVEERFERGKLRKRIKYYYK